MNLANLKNYFIKEKPVIIKSIILGSIFTATLMMMGSLQYSMRVQKDIADSLIRFHVRANSNRVEDQELKVQVKDKILEKFGDGLSDSASKEETGHFLKENIWKIREYARGEVLKQGYDYPVEVALTTDYFPAKTYGDITLPSGEYDTLRIDIGDAEGNNWWCVMFPPLCYVDITQEKLTDSSKNKFKGLLAEDEYDLISKYNQEGQIPIKVKFKVVEWWQDRLNVEEKQDISFALKWR